MNNRYITVQDIVQMLGENAHNPDYRVSFLQMKYWFAIHGKNKEDTSSEVQQVE